jgi:SAM-dependent methyltransferase
LLLPRVPKTRVVGIDGSESMLAIARQKWTGQPRVSFQQALADALPFGEQSFDWVVCCSSLHYFQQPAHVLTEFARVLKPTGQLVLLGWCRNHARTRTASERHRLVGLARGAFPSKLDRRFAAVGNDGSPRHASQQTEGLRMKAGPLGILSALTASACCLGPLVLALLGLGGLGIGATLGCYHPWFSGAAVVLLAAGWHRYAKELHSCRTRRCQMARGRLTMWSLIASSAVVAMFVLGG